MTHYEYICQRWPNHAQRIIEATYEQGRALAESVMVRTVEDAENTLYHLFIWGSTAEGHEYWKALAAGESVEVRK